VGKVAHTAIGHFREREAADAAFAELLGRGFSRDEIGIIDRGDDGRTAPATEREHATASGGAALGGITGLLVGVAAMLVPGIGPLVAVGPIAAGLAGAVTGGVTGAVVGGLGGALAHAGVPEEHARYYEERLREGGVLVTVHTTDETAYRQALQVLSRHGADVQATAGTVSATAATAAAAPRERPVERDLDQGPQHLELREEQLVPRKEIRQVGEVEIRTEVEEVPARAEAEVLREHLRLQHIPVNEAVKDRVAPWEEDGAYIVPVYEERLVLTKQLVLREYLRVERVPATERREFEDTVMRERLVVEDPDHTGRVDVEDGTPAQTSDETPQRPARRSA
jgi:uncharacterized protein (TIGR02271 family)